MPVPAFTHHPDPVATGSAAADQTACAVCRRPAGLRYRGPIYGRQVEVLCLRCIHDGRAATVLATAPDRVASFTDIDHDGSWAQVPKATVDEVLHRTPGFDGWQQPRWLAHCGDATVFLGPAGWSELRRFGADAIAAIRDEVAAFGRPDDEVDGYLRSLTVDGAPTAYLFRCRLCERHLAYSDFP